MENVENTSTTQAPANGEVLLDDVHVDMSIYPRAGFSEFTVRQYAAALLGGDQFPAIILEWDTNLLLDGLHRWKAHGLADRDRVAVDYHSVPEHVPLKLYAAELNSRHGDRVNYTERQEVARQTLKEHPHFSQSEIARRLHVSRQAVSKWTSDIAEHHKLIREIRVLILSRMGLSQQDIADTLDISQQMVSNLTKNVTDNILSNLTEPLLQEAAEIWKDNDNGELADVLEEIREEMIFGEWSEAERELLATFRSGEGIVVNMHDKGPHANLVKWLADTKQLTKADRSSKWGNPFIMPDDGTRKQVVRKYAKYYLPHKPMLLDRLPKMGVRPGVAGVPRSCATPTSCCKRRRRLRPACSAPWEGCSRAGQRSSPGGG